MRHINIPVFIPHEGCKNSCVFCNQRTITGQNGGADRDIIPEIERALSGTDEECEKEIAFFGGSFTGIDRKLMIRLLSDAYNYVRDRRVSSIRLSTRPDYIDEEILGILKKYGVKHIELGIQSMSDRVLSASKRGHTAKVTERACELVTSYGFELTGQMMIGLPESTLEDELDCAEKIVKMGAKSARVYPTVVFYGTELCTLSKAGKYVPLTVEDAVERSAKVCRVFADHGVKLLRVGLQSSDELCDPEKVYAGANHPSLGELTKGRMYFDLLVEKYDILPKKELVGKRAYLTVYCPVGAASCVAGQKKENKQKTEKYFENIGIGILGMKIKEDAGLSPFEVSVKLDPAKDIPEKEH